ncbi:MAG: hypothetical protein ACR2KK_11945 [Acidimicrobiales bacterium]
MRLPGVSGRAWRKARAAFVLLLVVASLAVIPNAAQGQLQAFGTQPLPLFPTNVMVGQQDVAAALAITNTSQGAPINTQTVLISNIRVNPSCAVQPTSASACTLPEPRPDPSQPIFRIDSPAVGRAGTACAGVIFTVSAPDANGTVVFMESAPVVLGPSNGAGPLPSSCVIDFTFDVVQRPNDGDTVANIVVQAQTPAINPTLGVNNAGQSNLIVVSPAPTSVVTAASPQTVVEGTPFTDTAVVTGVPNGPPLTGTVIFRIFRVDAPGVPVCSRLGAPPALVPTATAPTTLFATSGPVTATGVTTPDPVTGAPRATFTFTPTPPPGPGSYVFVATYDETDLTDVNYAPSTSGPVPDSCNDAPERVTVTSIRPTIAVVKTANPTQVTEPGGPVTFTVRVINTGPRDVTLTSLNDDIYGDLNGQGTCAVNTSPPPGNRPPAPPLLVANGGEYTCSFVGQVPRTGVGVPGGSQTDIVTAVGTDVAGQTATANDDAIVNIVGVPPQVAVTKTADPLTRTEPGGDFTYTVVVTNTSTVEPLTITSLTDSVYGDLSTRGTCTTAINTVLPVAPGPGNTYTCQFTAPFTGPPGSLTDVVTVVGRDDEGETATANDDAVVTITPIPPTVAVQKTADPLSRPEPGGDFTYTVVVTNTSTVERLTITSLNDSVYGNLATRGTCGALVNPAAPTVLAVAPGPGNTATCTFTAPFNGPGGSALTDVVTVVGTDDDGQTATANDDAVVNIIDVLPAVRVVKTANPTSLPAPGGDFTFTAVVSNPSNETIRITRIEDNIYGDLATRPGSTCGALIGTFLAPGASSAPCSFTAPFNGAPGAAQTDVITVTAVDDENNVVTDQDDAVVTITGAPAIRVDKTADPSSLPEPGGVFTFAAVVTNTGPEPLRIDSLTDDIYGNVATIPGSTCGALIGTTLAPGASTAPCTFPGTFTGVGGAQQRDVVTVVGTSPTGTQVRDDDDAIVTLTNVNPTIAVVKTANPLTMNAPGGTFTFTVVVTNTSAEPVIITDLDDDVYGDLAAPRPGSTCNTLIGTTLAPGASSPPCTFTGDFTGPAGASQTDIVTARATDLAGNPAPPATDDAVVFLINVVPDIAVVKSARPTTRPAPGGTFTFDVVVTNTGPNPLTITSLTDDIYGDLSTRGTCTTAVNTVLPSGGTYSCSFPGEFTGIGGAAQTDIVTVTGRDAAGTVVRDTDDATVTLTNVAPTVRVVKTADPLSRPEPGGTFTFTVVVTNTSPTERVRIDRLVDDIYGDLATRPGSTCGALIGTFLAAGASSAPCSFTGSFIGDAGASQTDVVLVTVTDDEGTVANDDDDAIVTITDIPPAINVVKDATPLSRPAPGGSFTFNVVVTNNSFEPVRITSLTDDVYGSLNGKGTCAVGALLAPSGGTYSCSFQGDFNGPPNASQKDIVTVVGVDNEGTPVTDSDDATVTLTPLPAVLTTQVSAGTVGGQVFDTATLRGGLNPTGTITFRLHGPNDDTCAAPPIFTNVKPVTGSTDPRIVVSDPFILPSTGTYHFVASYSGDANNAAIPFTRCDEPTETIAVGVVPIVLSTVASPGVVLGGSVFDTATIADGFNPTGTVTFTLFGPDNATCTGTPVFTSVKTVNGNGAYTSDPFTPTAPGVYRFIARYSGDTNNSPAVTPCADPLEQVTVTPLPVIQVLKTALPDTVTAPGGNVVFNVVVTNTSNVPLTIRTLTDNVFGDITGLTGSTCNTAIGTVLAPAPGPGNTYSCRFIGDVRGAAGSTHTDIVTVTAVDNRGNTVRDDDDAVVRIIQVPPTIVTTKVATPSTLPEPGGTFTFAFRVTNTGPEPVTITSLVDNVYGDLNGRGTCAIGARLAGNGGTYTCSFAGNFFGNAGAAQTDIITTTAVDDRGQTVTSLSNATVRITDIPPTITVLKSPDPVSRPEPGGTFRFTVTVTNTSFEPVTITSLVDDIYGDINGRGSCAVGVRLAPGGSYSCAFDGEFSGRAGATQTDTVTVIAVDDDNTPVTAIAKATVTLTPAGTPPVIPPPPPPPPPPPVTPPPPVRPPLVRTGSELGGAARLAGLLLLVGMTLVAATRRFGDDGPGLATVPAGPRGPRGPGSGGGGHWSGHASWFGGTPVDPPCGPLAGLGAGLVEAPPAPPAPEPATEPAWDTWVGVGEPVEPAVTDLEPEIHEVEPVVLELDDGLDEVEVVDEPMGMSVSTAEVLTATPVSSVPEVVVPEVVMPTFVQVRATNALDGAALDAAQALSTPTDRSAPPAGRRRGRKPGRS